MDEQEQRGVEAVMPMNKVITVTRLNRRRACCRSISSRCPGGAELVFAVAHATVARWWSRPCAGRTRRPDRTACTC
jgi:TPP-dependent trihydroxycyclohexane-1,2-dione (THcHDO) dehydratase